MSTQIEQLREGIESGESCVEAFEQVDLDELIAEGYAPLADKIRTVLILVGDILEESDVE